MAQRYMQMPAYTPHRVHLDGWHAPLPRLVRLAIHMLFAALIFAPSPADADQKSDDQLTQDRETTADRDNSAIDYREYPGFSGAFTGITVRGGVPLERLRGGGGWSIDAGLRHAFPAYVGDLRAAYHLERLGGSAESAATRHGLSLHAAFHPGFYFLAGSDWPAYVIASLYADIGVETALYTGMGDGNGFGLLPSFSAGVDMPLGDADAAPIPWLHISWRRYLATTNRSPRAAAPYSSIQIGLAWRTNRTLF